MKALIFAAILIFTPFMEHTDADVKMLGDVMWLENGYTGKTEQENKEVLIATGSVVINRVRSGEWGGDTIKDVIFAKGQYAKSTRDRIGKTDTPDWVYDLAEDMLDYGTNVPEYVVFQSMQPKLGTVWKVIDGEYFATSNGYKNEGSNITIKVNHAPKHRTIVMPDFVAKYLYKELDLKNHGYRKTFVDVNGITTRAYRSKHCDIIVMKPIFALTPYWKYLMSEL